ncbi:MAG: tetratricopeptide repeat protein [Planctomycetes bacterium]|nr:tetratricopeptide repeat protein [Planctomycetota bacterium]
MTELKPVGAARAWIASAAIVLLVGLVYAPIVGHGFVAYDTALYLTDNPYVNRGLTWDGVKWAFTSFYAANWHPLTWLSHMLDVALYGLAPAGHHVTNVVLHAVNAVLLAWFLARATGRFGAAVVIAALFAVHPLHVESVAWIVERKDVLSTLFGFAALLAWQVFARGGSRSAYLLALGLFASSLMSKPMLVTLPCVLLLLDAWPSARMARGWKTLVVEKIPFFALSAAASWITWRAQSAGGAVQGLGELAPAARLENALHSVGWYAGKTIWPDALSFSYPLTAVSSAAIVASAVFVILASVIAFATWRKLPWIGFGWMFFVGTLVPVLGLVQVGGQAHADRYMYVPIVGLFVALVISVDTLVREALPKRILAVAFVITAGILARQRLAAWESSETLARRALAVAPDNHVAHNLLGWTLVEAGRSAEGIVHLDKAVALEPRDPDARRNLGRALFRIGRFQEAERELQRALSQRPDDVRVLTDLGVLLSSHGHLDAGGGLLARAAALAGEAPDVRVALGEHLERAGDAAGAEREYRAAVELAPTHLRARIDLASACIARGRVDEARAHLDLALETDPTSPQALQLRARLRTNGGDAAGAIRDLRAALISRPEWPAAKADLAWLLATAPDAHLRSPREALQLASAAANAGNNERASYLDVVAVAFAACGQFEDAIKTGELAESRAREAGDTALAARIARRLAAYRAGTVDLETPR